MEEQPTPPFYRAPPRRPRGLALLRASLADPASVIPAAIYDEWALKLPGPGMPVVVAHPDSVRQILLDKGATFGRNGQLRKLMRRAWGDGLAAAEGEPWAAQRQAASPAFRPQAIEAALPAMAGIVREGVARWRSGDLVELRAKLGRIVVEIVLERLLARDEVDLDAVARDIPAVTREVTTFGLLDAMPLPDRVIARIRRFGRSAEEARLRLLAARLAGTAPAAPGHDVLSRLRGVGPLADNALGFMIAGLETTALGAAWAAYLLALYPDWQDAVRAEADGATQGGDGRDQRPVATQVTREALRLYPPAPILVRSAMRRTSIQGYRMWPHQAAIIPVYALHRHRRLWDRPDVFDPDRFGPSGTYDRAAYLPFGAGPRLCIAAAFATTEISVIISELVRAFRIVPAGPAPEVSLQVGTHSRTGLHVRIEGLERVKGIEPSS